MKFPAEGGIVFPGVNYWGKLTLVRVDVEKQIVMYKCGAGKGWSGIGTTSHCSPTFFVCKLNGDSTGGSLIKKYEIEYSREYTKKAKDIANELFDAMVRGEEWNIGEDRQTIVKES